MITADHPSSTACPIAPLAHEALGLIHALNRYTEHDCSELWERTNARLLDVQKAASLSRAVSREGQFFQTCVALTGLDWWDAFDPEELAEQQAARAATQAALTHLALALYTDAEAVLADYYLPFAVRDARAA